MSPLVSHLNTVRDLIRYAVSQFNAAKLYFGHGSDNAYDEAVYLVLHSLHLPIDQLAPFIDAKLLPVEINTTLGLIKRRCEERIPVAYLTRESWLQGFRFDVDERVIIPRSFIAELLVEQCQPWIGDLENITRVLDLCTGSGCLAIIAAHAFPNAMVDAVDISPDALAVAKQNIAAYELDERVTLHHSDLFSQLPLNQYDLIISNPPYVNANSMTKLPPEYQHEPTLALAGGSDGMDLVRTIIKNAHHYLSDEGMLLIEIGNEKQYAEAAFGELDLTWISTSGGDESVFLLHARQLS